MPLTTPAHTNPFAPENYPKTPDELHALIAKHFNTHVPRQAVEPDHAAPFAYLEHTFFENRQGPSDSVVWANRGGGKTRLGALATALDMIYKPGIEIRVLAGSMHQAKRMHEHLTDIFERDDIAQACKPRITTTRIKLANLSRVELLAQSQVSVRGTRVQKLRCDEVELFHPDVWAAAQLTTRSRKCGAFDVIGSIDCLSTMHKPYGLMRDLVAQAKEGKRRLFTWGVLDVLEACGPEHACESCLLRPECQGRAKARTGNDTGAPLGHIRVADAALMKTRVSLSSWNAEMLCLRPTRTDTVLPDFDQDLHVREVSLPPDAQIICGMDFGFRGATVVLWGAQNETGELLILDERVVEGVALAGHIAAIQAGVGRSPEPWPMPAWIGADPAGRQQTVQTGNSIIHDMRAAGLNTKCRPGKIEEGLELVRARLRPAAPNTPPRLFIHPRCEKLIEAIETYHYDNTKSDSMRPVKDGPDHAVDALRYLLMNLDRGYNAKKGTYAA